MICPFSPHLTNTLAIGSQQATQLSPRDAPPAECHDRKIKSEVKPSNKRGTHYLVGFIREMGGFADRGIPESRIYQSRIWIPRIRNPAIQNSPISESRNPTIRSPPISESGTQQPEILQSQNPIPRAYLIPYFFRIFTTGFLIDSAQRV